MKILADAGGIAATNCFLIADEISGQAVLFDAPDHTVAPLLDEALKRQWDVIGLWLTHAHFDHVADHAVVTAKFPNAKILIHRLDEPKLMMDMSKYLSLPFTIPTRKADGYVEDGQELRLGSIPVKVIHTPGHSPGHVMYHFPDQQILIGGDLIIMGAVGRTDFPDSNYEDLQASIQKVMKLPTQTRILPGHGDTSTLAEESERNPFVQEAMLAE